MGPCLRVLLSPHKWSFRLSLGSTAITNNSQWLCFFYTDGCYFIKHQALRRLGECLHSVTTLDTGSGPHPISDTLDGSDGGFLEKTFCRETAASAPACVCSLGARLTSASPGPTAVWADPLSKSPLFTVSAFPTGLHLWRPWLTRMVTTPLLWEWRH